MSRDPDREDFLADYDSDWSNADGREYEDHDLDSDGPEDEDEEPVANLCPACGKASCEEHES